MEDQFPAVTVPHERLPQVRMPADPGQLFEAQLATLTT